MIDQSVFDEAFELFEVDFSCGEDAVYTPALVLWALLSQSLFKEELRSCNAAVTRIAAWWVAQGRVVDNNSGAYCRARQKVPDELVAHLVRTIAGRAEQSSDLAESLDDEQAEEMLTPRAIAEVKSKPVTGRVLMVDGFTVDAADTPENQQEYPQNPAQEEGLGFPIFRCVSLISMATGMLVDLAITPYCGKETRETALLRQMIDSLRPGDILVADSYYCTYWLLAMCKARGVEVVMKNHHKREGHPDDAVRICRGQRKVVWSRPQHQSW
ncbi:Transposase DDE domain protein [Rosistilla ulvae]|uniref:Transposase DDE domain protein n=2 Tax=Rosistilla ulvae TaxID=1930277 RepID=A0A517M7B6_9BACT|nr:Transposase DDE domain protein [Rosistilla ulvae]